MEISAPERITSTSLELYNIAVLLPCYNEAPSIAAVVKAFQQALPYARVYVYDNNSTDNTAEIAAAAGAIVRQEARQGKGNVIRRMFAEIDADIYVMADGDLTYDASASPGLIQKLLEDKLDMVVGTRVEATASDQTYRLGHRFGNALFTNMVAFLFGKQFNDILSGFRVFSRRFVKSFPAASSGFDTEAELTIHSLELKLPVGEMQTKYFDRVEGSESKLSTYRDGFRVLLRVFLMLKETRPLFFFGVIGFALMLLSIMLSVPLFYSYLTTGLIPRIPTAILTTGVMLLGFLSLVCGIILDSVCRARRDGKYLHYLSLSWLGKQSVKKGKVQ